MRFSLSQTMKMNNNEDVTIVTRSVVGIYRQIFFQQLDILMCLFSYIVFANNKSKSIENCKVLLHIQYHDLSSFKFILLSN